MYPLVALLAAALATTGCSQTPEKQAAAPKAAPIEPMLNAAAHVDDCQPCGVEVSRTAGVYAFRFTLAPDGAGRVVKSIAVTPSGAQSPSQTLEVKDMMPVLPGAKIFFGGIDLNLDGSRDLMILTSQGAANGYATYWLFDSSTQRFQPLGDYPVFTQDPVSKRLKTHERGGSGGLLYESKEYAFEDGKLIVMRVEKQEAIEGSENFRKTIQERKGSDLVTTKQQTVKAPK
jgi:hypothetical protein